MLQLLLWYGKRQPYGVSVGRGFSCVLIRSPRLRIDLSTSSAGAGGRTTAGPESGICGGIGGCRGGSGVSMNGGVVTTGGTGV